MANSLFVVDYIRHDRMHSARVTVKICLGSAAVAGGSVVFYCAWSV